MAGTSLRIEFVGNDYKVSYNNATVIIKLSELIEASSSNVDPHGCYVNIKYYSEYVKATDARVNHIVDSVYTDYLTQIVTRILDHKSLCMKQITICFIQVVNSIEILTTIVNGLMYVLINEGIPLTSVVYGTVLNIDNTLHLIVKSLQKKQDFMFFMPLKGKANDLIYKEYSWDNYHEAVDEQLQLIDRNVRELFSKQTDINLSLIKEVLTV